MPVIESSPDESGRMRSRIRLAVDYLKVKRRPATIALVAAAIVGTSVALLLPSKYTARASFYSEGKQSGDLSSLSSSLGPLSALLSMAGGSMGSNSPTFFVDLLKSQSFFDSLGVSPIPVDPTGRPVLVKDYVIKSAKNDSI